MAGDFDDQSYFDRRLKESTQEVSLYIIVIITDV